MTTYAETGRALARAALRDAALDVLARSITAGEPGPPMAAVARAVGVSRQTLYAEFGSREALVTALADRENLRLLTEVVAALDAHGDDLVDAVAAAAEVALRSSAEDVLHKALLAGDPAVTGIWLGQGEPLLQRARHQLADVVVARFPMLDPTDTALLADVVVRVVQSHIVWPSEPVEATVARVRRLVERYLAGGPGGPDRQLRRVEPARPFVPQITPTQEARP